MRVAGSIATIVRATLACITLATPMAARAQPADGPVYASQQIRVFLPELDARTVVVATADLDGDGTIDFAVPASGGFYLAATTPDGRLRPTRRLDFGRSGEELVAGDFNNDGVTDLVGTDLFSMHVFLGTGGGAFELGQSVSIPREPEDVCAGDFDGDGDLDIAIAIFGDVFAAGDTIAVLRNRGDGTFDDPAISDAGLDPVAIASADFDGDGFDDVAVGHQRDPFVLVYPGGPGGTLGAPIRLDIAGLANCLGIGDADGDGALDILVGHSFTAGATLIYGDGAGGFGEARPLDIDQAVSHARIALYDGDGVADLVLTIGSEVVVLKGLGGRAFEEASRDRLPYIVSNLLVQDLNGDGLADLAVPSSGWFVLQLRRPDGALPPPLESKPVGTSPTDIARGDVNGDGVIDLAVADTGNPSGGGVFILLGDGTGGFLDATRVHSTRGVSSVTLADLDLDGDLDIVFRSSAGSFTMAGGGDGTFEPATPIDGIASSVSPSVGDVTGDGVPDLVVLERDAGEIRVHPGLGDLSFAAPIVTDTLGLGGPIALGDATGDGEIDVVVAASDGATPVGIYTFAGRGDGTFGPPVESPLDVRPTNVAADDLDGDGDLDLVIGHRFDDGTTVALGAGDGTFALAGFYFDQPRSTAEIADVTGDGKLDILNANWTLNSISVLRGHGDGTFDEPEFYRAGTNVDDTITLDADGDGQLDAVALNNSGGGVSVLPNICGVGTVCTPDLDGDGTLTIFDFLVFGNLFDLADPRADFDGDGSFTIFDFLAFQNAFDAGCG